MASQTFICRRCTGAAVFYKDGNYGYRNKKTPESRALQALGVYPFNMGQPQPQACGGSF